jgi:hypothetical protein
MKKPAKIVLGVLVALILGTAIGASSAMLANESVTRMRDIQNGAWRTNLAVGSNQADIYTRAWVAIHGLFALTQHETIYYQAYFDDSGQLLSGDSTYRIEGKAPDARWWSITAYGADDFLIPNALNRYSYSGNSVTCDQDGKFTIYLSKTQRQGDWLPLGDQKTFNLSLRLYNPGETIRNNPASVELPHVIKEVGK